MKKTIIFLIILVLLAGCKIETADINTVSPVNPDTGTEAPGTDPIQVPENVVFAMYDGATLRYFDGTQTYTAYFGVVKKAGTKILSIDDILYYFDSTGSPTASYWLPVVPDGILAVQAESDGSKAVAYEDDIWTLETIPAMDAYALGALPKPYTRIFKNNEEIGEWYYNQWETDYVIQPLCGDILVKTKLGHWIDLTDDTKDIDIAYHEGIILYDQGTEEGWIADDSGEYYVTWEMNWFDHSVWQLADGVWYTENGYTWAPETGVISNANEMYCWNYSDTWPSQYNVEYGEKPWIISAGVRTENSEEVTYWIETVSGGLYRHIPSIDRLDFIVTLYFPPRTRVDATVYHDYLNPEIINNHMYFHADGNINTYDFDSGVISVFSSDQELIVW